jgi:hypothetical protein
MLSEQASLGARNLFLNGVTKMRNSTNSAPLDAPAAESIVSMTFKTKDAALYIGTTARSLEDWRQKGIGPVFVRMSRRAVRYRKIDLDKWLESQLKTSTSAP